MDKVLILFSGGLESTSLIEYFKELGYETDLLYVQSGYIWENTELAHAKKIANYYDLPLNIVSCKFGVKQLGFVKEKKDNIIPLRNLTLTTIATNYAISKEIYMIAMGLFGDKDYPDTSRDYLNKIEKLIAAGSCKNFKILTPFYGKTKNIIYDTYKDKIPIKFVFSCANPHNGKRCNKCYKCKSYNKIIHNICK
jgi:7-cyano-7-deazaguanine synthase